MKVISACGLFRKNLHQPSIMSTWKNLRKRPRCNAQKTKLGDAEILIWRYMFTPIRKVWFLTSLCDLSRAHVNCIIEMITGSGAGKEMRILCNCRFHIAALQVMPAFLPSLNEHIYIYDTYRKLNVWSYDEAPPIAYVRWEHKLERHYLKLLYRP